MTVQTQNQIERRKYQRIEHPFKLLHAPFQFPGVNNRALKSGTILNVSAVGILLETDYPYQAQKLVRLEIRLGTWDYFKTGFFFSNIMYQGEPFVALGKVLRVKNNHAGTYKVAIQFISVDEGHQLAVAKYINYIKTKEIL